MRCPSKKSLMAAFPNLTDKQALLIRKLAKAVNDGETLRGIINTQCPKTAAGERQMHSDPYYSGMWRRTMALRAIDETLGTFGVEPLGPVDMHDGPPHEYCNAGDSYAATIIYTSKTDTLRIGCWGDIAEKHSNW